MHVIDLFDAGARNYPDQLVLTGAGGDVTYAETWAFSNRLARAMLADGAKPGTKFAALSPNSSLVMAAMLGAMRAGGAWCNINLRAAVDANVDILRRGRCEFLFFHSSVTDLVPAFTAAIPELRKVICLDSADTPYPSMSRWVAEQSDSRLDYRVPVTSLGVQGSTGGTSGTPKLTRASNEWLAMSTLAWATCWHFDAPPVNVAMTPVTHAAGCIALAHLQFGGATVFMETPDLDQLLDIIENRHATTLFLPPTLIYALLAHPRLDETNTSSLRYLISAAAPIAPEKMVEGVERLGPVLCQAYGQTEAGFPLTWISPAEVAAAARDDTKHGLLLSCGRPTLICEALEAMSDDGQLLPPGETGEIVLRGPTVMLEYLDDPVATAEVQAHGWHHTGDIGRREADGYVYITDRKRDMIVSGGFNIFPFEIEQVLLTHPAVQDCAVIAVPDPKWGEAVKACVELKPGAAASAAGLIDACKAALGSMKAPKSIDFVDTLPRSPVGKVLKRVLREPYWAGQSRQVS
jgi:acyl-CoA synthetase (AMP-forming)/AMP-acid ligase II